MSTPKLIDVWARRDFPVLREVTRRIDQDGLVYGGVRLQELPDAVGLTLDEVGRAAEALERRGLITLQRYASGGDVGPWRISDVAGEAYLLTGLHPDGHEALGVLIDVLRQAAEQTTDSEEKSRLKRAATALGEIGGAVGANVLAAFLSHMGGF